MPTLAGLYWYEVVLLVLGVVLFVVLLLGLRRNLGAGKSYAGLLPFFVLSIAMMGYPSITSIRYEGDMVEIETTANAIESNPTDPQNKARGEELQAKLSSLALRAASVHDKAIIERAQRAVKLTEAARGGTNTQNSAELLKSVETLTDQLEAHPNQTELRKQLADAVHQLKGAGGSSPAEKAAIERAEKLLAHSIN